VRRRDHGAWGWCDTRGEAPAGAATRIQTWAVSLRCFLAAEAEEKEKEERRAGLVGEVSWTGEGTEVLVLEWACGCVSEASSSVGESSSDSPDRSSVSHPPLEKLKPPPAAPLPLSVGLAAGLAGGGVTPPRGAQTQRSTGRQLWRCGPHETVTKRSVNKGGVPPKVEWVEEEIPEGRSS